MGQADPETGHVKLDFGVQRLGDPTFLKVSKEGAN